MGNYEMNWIIVGRGERVHSWVTDSQKLGYVNNKRGLGGSFHGSSYVFAYLCVYV